MAKRRVKGPGGQEFMAEPVEFETEKENWNTYVLHDGTELKLKTILAEVLRVDGQFAPNGDPVYVVNASTIVNTNVPDNLKRKA